ncbi:MAG: YerC/YecD family TrpR-related protein [Candidatus Gracilibacteria bacterium]|nr:YerC/YecD family TrpR-related protein [Candidatus Gracilibacteria bacterium]
MSRKWNDKIGQDLIKVITSLKNEQEAQKFLRDLLTEQEIIEFSKRWQATQLLDQKIPYTEIVKETGLSSTTIARISDWLQNGQGGYRLMLERVVKHHNST